VLPEETRIFILMWIITHFGSGTDLISLLIFLLLGQPSLKCPMLRCVRSDVDEIWQHCSSSKYALLDRVGFWMRSYLLDGGHADCSSGLVLVGCLQFLIHSMFVLIPYLKLNWTFCFYANNTVCNIREVPSTD